MKVIGTIVGLLLVCTYSISVYAQRDTGAAVRGVVTDAFGAVVPEALVIATSKTGKKFESKSGSDGRYKLRMPSGGVYKIQVVFKPYKVFVIDEYQLIGSANLNLDVSLICEDCEKLSLPFNRLGSQAVPAIYRE